MAATDLVGKEKARVEETTRLAAASSILDSLHGLLCPSSALLFIKALFLQNNMRRGIPRKQRSVRPRLQ